MQMKFEVIRVGDAIFEFIADGAKEADLSALTSVALKEFQKKHAKISLLDEDVILKWSKVEA